MMPNISTKKVNVISSMYDYYHGGIGQKKYFQVVVGDCIMQFLVIILILIMLLVLNVMDSLLYGDKSKKIQKAGDIVLDMVKSA